MNLPFLSFFAVLYQGSISAINESQCERTSNPWFTLLSFCLEGHSSLHCRGNTEGKEKGSTELHHGNN
ncbi:hypothetical protein V6Z12_A04G073000 [Gossypium hirsutum]